MHCNSFFADSLGPAFNCEQDNRKQRPHADLGYELCKRQGFISFSHESRQSKREDLRSFLCARNAVGCRAYLPISCSARIARTC